MSRKLRFVPEGGALVEVTCRTIQGRYLLRPSQQLNDILLGVLGRAQRLHPVEICSFTFLSSHYHMLLRVPDAQQLASWIALLPTASYRPFTAASRVSAGDPDRR